MSDGIRHTTHIRVRYADTDAMRFVYHGNYLTYFEEARTELLRAVGFPYSAVEEQGLFVVVLEAHVNYGKPATYDDLLHVTATVRSMPTLKIQIDYSITKNDESETIITGTTVHAFISRETLRPMRPPREFSEKLQPYFKTQ